MIALDQREDIGGVWNYSDDPTVSTVMKSTVSTSSTTVTEMSDYPMPQDAGQFLHHSQVMSYLRSYIETFKLDSRIKCGTTVTRTEKKGDLWWVYTNSAVTYTSKYLVICSGLTKSPNLSMADKELKGFTGKIHHSIEIKEPMVEYKGQRLLLVGGGETAADIITDWFDLVGRIHWSISRGQQFFSKYAKILPWKPPQALDKASSRAITTIAPYHLGKPGLSWICKWTTNGSLLAYHGHGIPEWWTKTPFFRSTFNKNGNVLQLVDYKKLIPKGAIVGVNKKRVTFVDGSSEEFDVVIICTGYNPEFSLLPSQYGGVQFQNRFKYIFDANDPSIAFVGFVRPCAGSIPTISEIQSRLAAKVFSGQVHLPSFTERLRIIRQDDKLWRKFFEHNKHEYEKCFPIVEGYLYIESLAKLAQINPNYWSLLKENPRDWYIAVFAPYNGCIYRLNDPSYRSTAIATLNSHRRGTTHPLHLLLILFLRFTLIDWFLEKLSTVKYYCQVSQWWKSVRNYRVIRAANYIWCIPKRLLFHQVSFNPAPPPK